METPPPGGTGEGPLCSGAMDGAAENRRRAWIWSGVIGLCALAAQAAGPAARTVLRYQREAILDGQFWRLITGQLVHLGWSHLGLNLAGLALLTALFGPVLRSMAAVWTGAFAGTALGLLVLEPELQWYVGLSGALHGLFAAGALTLIARDGREGWLLLGALVLKLVWEQLAGPLPGSESWTGGPVVTAAHLYGALGGGTAVLVKLLPRLRRPGG